MSAPADDPIEQALADGRVKDAAALLAHAGRLEEAAARYAEVWCFADAARLALQAELPVLALGYALDANDAALLAPVLVACEHARWALDAARFAQDRRRPAVAARLYLAAGESVAAAESFERAGQFRDAASAREAAGQAREAGRLYERGLREHPEDIEAALALARILCRFGRYEPAARVLQSALEIADLGSSAPCQRLLVACLDAMGAPEAAAEALARLRRVDSAAPSRVADLLTGLYGTAEGLRAQRGDGAELLGGRYRVVRELGEGGSGRVLLADDIFHGRAVAVKVLRLEGGLGGRDALARFLREAQVAASIDDPHVVHVYEADASGPFLVMEYMEGGTLEERLARAEAAGRTLPGRELETLLDGLLAGLEAVHRRGIIHRDLKPQNVFFGAAGELKIGDFGVAHLAEAGATATGAMLGTLAYMAPEQVALSSNPTAATDLYALGVMLYRMLTGSLPFSGEELAMAKLDEAAEPPSGRSPALGHDFDPLLARLLAREPSDRPQSSEDVRLLLAALRFPPDGVPVVAAESGPSPAANPSRPPAAADRYEALDVASGRTLDRLLDRPVFLRALSPASAARLKAFARADHPNLQAVFSVDETLGRAILEAPQGEPWRASDDHLDSDRAALMEALSRVHAEGIMHGAIDAAHLLHAPGRTVLLIAEERGSAGQRPSSVEQERRALAALLS